MGKQITCSRSVKQRRPGVRAFLCTILGLAVLGSMPVAAADLMHNSRDTGSTRWNGRWGIAGGRYGEFTCATCHEPLAENLKNIRKTISVMNPWSSHTFPGGSQSVTVNFQNNTSMGNDRAAHTTSNRICEVCHSQLTYHNTDSNNNTGNPKLGHPAQGGQAGVCTSCHSHNTGFKASCGGCHGNPPTTSTLGAPDGLIKTPKASKALKAGEAGVHEAHTDRGMVCDTCHYISDGSIKMPNLSNTIQIGFYGFGGKVTSGKYVPWSSAGRGYRVSSSTPNTTMAKVVSNYTNANKCSQVYCHGGGVKVGETTVKPPINGFGSYTTWWWSAPTGTATCGSCHPSTASNPPTLGSHQKHTGLQSSGYYEIACDKCHPSSVDNSHVQGVSRWELKTADPKLGTLATYRGSATTNTNQLAPNLPYGQCANFYCHSNGAGGQGNIASPAWGDSSGFANCAGCHGGNETSGTPISSGKHASHINTGSNSSLGTAIGCAACHGKTVSNDTAISIVANHVNTLKEYSGARAGKNYTPADGVCANVYCHSDGKGRQSVPFTAGTGWNSSTVYADCIQCHGTDNRFGHFSSIAGEPNYKSGAQGSYSANSHRKHVVNYGGAATCYRCHVETVSPAGNSILSGSIKHVDGTPDVKADGTVGSFNWNKSPRTCTSNVCHFNKTVTWGGTLNCNGCHGADAATLTTKKHSAHISTSANPSLGTALGCVECHSKTVSSNLTISGYAVHSNKVYG
ncbi:CxxxxCH/CxxCH domain-containing protein, partial [Geobacter sp. OR-1]|uniref:CxxxxCH/CxxCH domain c-type cytochrome n=1 Tax=Geobacter sp. OR-1 TaxID=1266765 RepID=UPI001364B430